MNLSHVIGGKHMNKLFMKEHVQNLPTIRISALTLENFKSVKHGSIVFNCGKKHIPYGTQSDVLGVYGQNGSGKTSLIEAISILKHLMSGVPVPDEYADCIDVQAEYSTLTFTFDFQYPNNDGYPTNNDLRKVVYTFKIRSEEKEEIEAPRVYVNDESLEEFIPTASRRVVVFDEVLKMSGTICGEKIQLKPFCDTTKEKPIIGPVTKAKKLVGVLDEDKRIRIAVNKNLAESRSQSFIFMPEMLKLFRENSDYSAYYQTIAELFMWAKYYLFVVDSKSTGLIRLNFMLPIYAKGSLHVVPVDKRFTCSDESLEDMVQSFSSLSMVLSQIVPGLTVEILDHGKTLLKDGGQGHRVELVARRNDVIIPLRGESDGVRKLLSTLNLLIMVYNQQSTTVAYDEFDAGVFEYLLGEILQIIQATGKGQFIFTSHNMRPLEVLKKEYIWFTTTNPDDRYVKLTNLGETNNLRRVYYREIEFHEHYDNLYSDTYRNKIISAFRKAGR